MTENDISAPERARVLSGMRPTGRLHLGNYMGALYNWVKLQHDYDCFFFIADYHALTTDYVDTSRLQENIFEVALDFLSAGLDPAKSTIFIQSQVPQHAELHLLLSMFTPLSLLERVPSYKDQQEQLREKNLATYGFLGYPLLQSADILLYRPHYVPVGQDQAAHVELTRETARRFNHLYSPKRLIDPTSGSLAEEPDPGKLILPEPEVLLTPSPKLPGLDGRKMSKSYGNSILLSDPAAVVGQKMARMTNGGQRNPQSRPGNPDMCPVGDMHALFSKPYVDEHIRAGCRTAEILCISCKELAAGSIIVQLLPIQDRRQELEKDPDQVSTILEQGAKAATCQAEETMAQVREVMGLSRRRLSTTPLRNAVSSDKTSRVGSDLSDRSSWWDLSEASLREKNLRELWLSQILPWDLPLAQDADRVFTTRKGKRVFVTTARELHEGSWTFFAKPKTYELLALLCWDRHRWLHDFIVPQIEYVAPWTACKKANKNDDIHFTVRRDEENYYLEMPNAQPIDITRYRGDYGPMV